MTRVRDTALHQVMQRRDFSFMPIIADRPLKAAAERVVAEDQRSLASLIEKLLTDFPKKNGYLA
jgi:hypothetical protein